jgi:hypothetical protein
LAPPLPPILPFEFRRIAYLNRPFGPVGAKRHWDWWPLRPLAEQLPDDMARLKWGCVRFYIPYEMIYLKILQACGHTRLVDISKDILDGYVKSVPATSPLESLPKTGITPRYVQQTTPLPIPTRMAGTGPQLPLPVPSPIYSGSQTTPVSTPSSPPTTSSNLPNQRSSLTCRPLPKNAHSSNSGQILMSSSEHVLFVERTT